MKMDLDLSRKVMVLQAIGASVQTLLGPNKSLKCYISRDPDENGLIGDTMQVLEALLCGFNDGHPIGQVVYDCCREQQKSCGCGVTTLVCLSSYWASEILSLVSKSIPLPVIFVVFDELLEHCNTVFTSLALPLKNFRHKRHKEKAQPSPKAQITSNSITNKLKSSSLSSHRAAKVLSFSRHFSGGAAASQNGPQSSVRSREGEIQQQTSGQREEDTFLHDIGCTLTHGKQLAMQLASKAVQIQMCATGGEQRTGLDDSLIFEHCVVGKSQDTSEIFHGLVANLEPAMAAVVRHVLKKHLKVVIVEGDCTPSWRHLGLQKVDHMTSHDPQQLYESSRNVVWLKKCVTVLEKVGVLVVSGLVSPLLWEHCLATGIVVLTKLTGRQLDGMCRLSKVTPISYITQCMERHLGSVTVDVVECGWWSTPRGRGRGADTTVQSLCCKIQSLSTEQHHPVVTAILCGRSESCTDSLRHQFTNCIQRLKLTLKDAHLLPGAGRTEARCVHTIQEKLKQLQNTHSSTHVTSLPVAMATSWMGDPNLVCDWKRMIYEGFVNGLKRYMVQVELNCNPDVGYYVAMTTVQSKIESCDKMVVDWKEEMLSRQPCVCDVVQSKRESWRRAVGLLRRVFLGRRVDMQS